MPLSSEARTVEMVADLALAQQLAPEVRQRTALPEARAAQVLQLQGLQAAVEKQERRTSFSQPKRNTAVAAVGACVV